MKKQILFLLAIAFAIFVSCNDNDDKKQNPPPVETETTANVTYTITGADDELSLFTVTAVYTDASGEEQSEAVTSLPWTKSLTGVTLPFDAKVEADRAARTDFPEKASYKVGINPGLSFVTNTGRTGSYGVTSTLTIGRDKVEAYQLAELGREKLLEETIAAQ